ncbi:MAG: carbohydrate ABC transporter permease [candidate division NC10 bacterium]|nr:carbohydrate ABC transporter permease [candidate division NC10 bacterium]
MGRPRPTRKMLADVAYYIGVVAICVPFVFVFYWMVLGGLKTQVQNTASPPLFLFTPTFENFRKVFVANQFLKYIENSIVVSGGATLLALALGLPAAHAIARYRQRGVALGILVARMAPHLSYVVPFFILFQKLGWIDTYACMILTHLVITLPIVVWIMIGAFEDVPLELEEAARIDGCSRWRVFTRISLPVCRTSLATATILGFIFSWNNFIFALILTGPERRTLPVAVFNFISGDEIDWGGLSAAATMITLPILLLILLVQRHIVQGMTAGGLKE